jgi:hypothetical protein
MAGKEQHRGPAFNPMSVLAAVGGCCQVQDLLAQLTTAQQLIQRVLSLEAANASLQSHVASLQQQLQAALQQQQDCVEEAAAAAAAAAAADAAAGAMRDRLEACTPRPKRGLGILSDLLQPQEQILLEQALVAGAGGQEGETWPLNSHCSYVNPEKVLVVLLPKNARLLLQLLMCQVT